ncbi:alpha-methylacyl-CoA racemase [Humitalea rosea]|uniref:Alpha-methylacyl-CoA racemase n=1 Tax=Humitalea rosea TaxID=990373 RepID=A0A2W7IMQ6_9PROT|nr:CaiB/BaiF CoA-transferase family protein [Humitalea rosea]PZW48596.1 alpha-methylacyl-CoA racemase [Humitalea rosea]
MAVVTGPLAGLRVLEFGAIGPVPFAAMLLADMGAEVVQVVRPGPRRDPRDDPTLRGRCVIVLDLKQAEDQTAALDLAARAEVLLEGNRPGVMERLGLGPDTCLAHNPRLVYGRMTGWGQDGPLARTAGHDINFIALTGALHAIGPAGGAPVPPLNLVGDYGGGSMFLLFGVLCAVIEARASGRGQVVDAAMVDGASAMMAVFHGMAARSGWVPRRGENLLDGGAPWYTTYETADGGHVAVGALEEPFWKALLAGLGIAPDALPPREDRAAWPVIRAALAQAFRRGTREEWAERLGPTEACVSPVLPLEAVAAHPHMAARRVQQEIGGQLQPAPAPRLSRTRGAIRPTTEVPGGAAAVLARWSAASREEERTG